MNYANANAAIQALSNIGATQADIIAFVRRLSWAAAALKPRAPTGVQRSTRMDTPSTFHGNDSLDGGKPDAINDSKWSMAA